MSIYGDVALNGTVASYPQCLEAAAASTLEAEGIAAATTGVAIA